MTRLSLKDYLDAPVIQPPGLHISSNEDVLVTFLGGLNIWEDVLSCSGCQIPIGMDVCSYYLLFSIKSLCLQCWQRFTAAVHNLRPAATSPGTILSTIWVNLSSIKRYYKTLWFLDLYLPGTSQYCDIIKIPKVGLLQNRTYVIHPCCYFVVCRCNLCQLESSSDFLDHLTDSRMDFILHIIVSQDMPT